MCRIDPAEDRDAERHADGSAKNEGPEPVSVERPAQLPYRITLHHEAQRDDQGGGLERRKDVEPHRRGDEPEGEAGEARDQRGRERGAEKEDVKQGWFETQIHVPAPTLSEQRLDAISSDGEAAVSPVSYHYRIMAARSIGYVVAQCKEFPEASGLIDSRPALH